VRFLGCADYTTHLARAAKRGDADAKRGEPHALDAIINEGTLTIGWVSPAL